MAIQDLLLQDLLLQDLRASAWFLAARLQLLLERRQLGERRIRIGFFVATVPALASPLDVFRAQGRIAIRLIAAWSPVGAVATRRAGASLRAARTIRARRLISTIRALLTLGAILSILAILAVVTAIPALVGRGRSIRSTRRGCRRSFGVDGSGPLGDGGGRRLPLRPALARTAFVARLAWMMLLAAAGPPDLDQFLRRRLRLRRDLRRW